VEWPGKTHAEMWADLTQAARKYDGNTKAYVMTDGRGILGVQRLRIKNGYVRRENGTVRGETTLRTV